MSVPCLLEVIFAPIAVTTRLAASTVPVLSVATPWHSMGAAARVSCLHCNTRLAMSASYFRGCFENTFFHFLFFCSQILMNAWQERTHAQRIRAALMYREDSDACPSSVQTTTGALEKREYLDCVSFVNTWMSRTHIHEQKRLWLYRLCWELICMMYENERT